MNFLIYLLSSVIVFFGLVLGAFQIFFAPEELKPGKKYFYWTFYIMFSSIISVLVHYYLNNFIISVMVFVFLFVVMFFAYSKFHFLNYFIYPVYGLFLGLVNINQNYFLLLSGLVFLSGMPFGSLSVEEYKKKNRVAIIKKIVLQNLSYFVFIFIGYFITVFLN